MVAALTVLMSVVMPAVMAVMLVPVLVLGTERAGGFEVSAKVGLNGFSGITGRAHDHVNAEAVEIGDGAAADATGNNEPDARSCEEIGHAPMRVITVRHRHTAGDFVVFCVKNVEVRAMPEMRRDAAAFTCYRYFHYDSSSNIFSFYFFV
jgi:hypothetical protein